MRNTLRTAALATAVLCALGVSTANAAAPLTSPQTTTFLVSITIQNECSVAAQPIAFGTVTDMTPIHDAQGNVTVTCTGKSPLNLQLNAGTGTGSTLAVRKMKDTASANTVDYNLYNDNTHSTISGDGTTTGLPLFTGTSTGGNATDTFTVYGETAAGQNALAGTYNSTVTATLTF